ncbi:MAG: 3-hexulose-6-phosphate synthase [Erysipelotrichaceae bacterium]
MKIQVALDTLSLEESIDLIESIKDDINIIEVGTPFIIEQGIYPVKVLKERFPHLEVLADLKIMDAGEYEAKKAYEVGADIVTVLGVSNVVTIEGVVKAAKQYGKKVMVDMIEVSDIVNRGQQLIKLGVDYLCVHTAFDVQSVTNNPLKELQQLSQVVNCRCIGVAGGVKLNTINEISLYHPEIIVVGQAICASDNPIQVTKEMRGIIDGNN